MRMTPRGPGVTQSQEDDTQGTRFNSHMRMTPRGPCVTQSHEDDTRRTRCNTVT